MKISARFLILLGSCLLFGACSLKKTAEDTASTTKEMNETTKEMNDNTKELKATSEALREKTDALESELTYKESHDQMMKHFNWLFQEGERVNNRGLIQSTYDLFFGLNDDPDLFIAGAGAILSMHFQFWNGFEGQDMGELDKRLDLGSEALFDRLFKHVPRDGDVNVMRPDVSFKGVAALGAKMDMIDDRFERGLKRRGFPRLTYYDFVVMALNQNKNPEVAALLPRTMAKIRQWVPEASYLLQLRQNILPVMVVSRITDFQDRKDLRRGWMLWWGQTVSVEDATSDALREWTVWLNKAATTRQDLRAMGIKPQYNSNLANLVAGVDFGQNEMVTRKGDSEHDHALRDFAEAYLRNVAETIPQEDESSVSQ